MAEFRNTVPLLFFIIMAFLIMFLILIYPQERAEILGEDIGITVEIRDQQFVPEIVTIRIGGTVSWVNMDSVKHRVVGLGFNSGVLNPGDSFSYKFTEAGIYAYSSEFYPAARGQIIVK